ncbi:V-set and immunoglobulin domain-containing protein 4-like isoform X2 [Rhineura floridana]|uniref:V-set and immunoglobulin domain-containing protein 4-like isoform X2 n=1 Tax=Rhineura floridana TaxID=261503 RepID=UPI002AC875BB|nr:V-set and immunoglobulin domain-containing protein 4-like isoform X2 [Rhineura floridana]
MGQLAWLWLLPLASTISGKAVLDLTGTQETQGTWRASVTLPCVYKPSPDFQEQSVIWRQPDHNARSIFHRDKSSGDQTLLTSYKNRLTVPKQPPGDVSLQIEELEMTDSGQYTCEVAWVAKNKSRIIKARTIMLRVEKVPVTKPVIKPSSMGSILPRGTKTNLTCLASGSPPIRYRWFKEVLGSNAKRVGEEAVLVFDRLQTLDTGRYYCEAENRASTQSVEQSDFVQLMVEEMTTTEWKFKAKSTAGPFNPKRTTTLKNPVSNSSSATHEERASEWPGPRRATLPLYVIILIAVLCAVLVLVVLSVVFCRRKTKTDLTYEVAYNNNATNITNGDVCPASPGGATGACECEYEEPTIRIDNYTIDPMKGNEYVIMDTKTDNEYESLVRKMESEYEVVDTK